MFVSITVQCKNRDPRLNAVVHAAFTKYIHQSRTPKSNIFNPKVGSNNGGVIILKDVAN